MKRLRKFFNLTHSDRQLLISTFILLALVRLGLWLLPFQRLRQLLSKISQLREKPPAIDRSDLRKIVGAVNLSSRYMPGEVKCLARALTTQILMTWYGYLPELRIGVAKKEGGKLEAHAWVESQGEVVMGYLTDLASFTPLPPLEGADRL